VSSVVASEGRDYIRLMRACHLAAVLLATAAVLASAGCSKSTPAPMADVTANEHGFTPASLKIPSGGPGSRGTVSFVRTTDQTCATEVVFPDLKLQKDLPLNQVVKVDLPTDTAKTLTFQCGMGMYKGAVVVATK
jgi:plastocyanin domain-containing protein